MSQKGFVETIALITTAFLLFTIPVAVKVAQTHQENRSHAAESPTYQQPQQIESSEQINDLGQITYPVESITETITEDSSSRPTSEPSLPFFPEYVPSSPGSSPAPPEPGTYTKPVTEYQEQLPNIPVPTPPKDVLPFQVPDFPQLPKPVPIPEETPTEIPNQLPNFPTPIVKPITPIENFPNLITVVQKCKTTADSEIIGPFGWIFQLRDQFSCITSYLTPTHLPAR